MTFMANNSILRRIASAFILSMAIISGCSEAYANLDGRWVQHPGSNMRNPYKFSHVDRIIDGEKYVYFSVRGIGFDRGTNHLFTSAPTNRNNYMDMMAHQDFDPIQLFRYDKSEPWEDGAVKPVAQQVELSGNLPTAMEYSPEWGVMALSYDNRMIDFIHDDGTLVQSRVLAEPGIAAQPMNVNSFTFDLDRPLVYVASGFGYAVVNINTGELEDWVKLDRQVAWAGRVGDNMVIFAGTVAPKEYVTETYIYPADKVPSTLADPVKNSSNLQALMPLGPYMFAAMAPGASDQYNSLELFLIKPDASVTKEQLMASAKVDDAALARYRHKFRTDGFVNATKEGYAIFNGSEIIFLKKGLDPQQYKNAALLIDAMRKVLSKQALDTKEKDTKASTFDGQTFWFYTYDFDGPDSGPRGFYSRTFSNAAWSPRSAVVAPTGPASSLPRWMAWTPKHGVIMRGPGSYSSESVNDCDWLCSYKDGKWTDLSPILTMPTYNKALTEKPKYLNVDPLNEDWIWGNSPFYSFYRLDLGNPSNFFGFGANRRASLKATNPGYFPELDSDPLWQDYFSMSNASFDNEGRMWVARYYLSDGDDDSYVKIHNAKTKLYYYTADERLAMADMTTPGATFITPHEILIPRVSLHNSSVLCALKGKGNENYLAASPIMWKESYLTFFIYDHNGTPDDVSDDRYVVVDELFDESGERFDFTRFEGLYEDEDTGEVWFSTNQGVIKVNPSDLLNGDFRGKRPKISRKFGVPTYDLPFESIVVGCIDKDIFGRYWIGTDSGLYCLSADGEELLGYYTADNSGLPFDEVVGLVCDKATGAVFVTTTRGVAEFQPEGAGSSQVNGEHLTIWPSTITPHFKGYVNIYGAVNSAEYVVEDAMGNKVVSLGKPDAGTLQWDGRDASGLKAAPGKYNIRRIGETETHTLIIVD